MFLVGSFFRWLIGANVTDSVSFEFAPSFQVTKDPVRHSIIFGNDEFGQRSIEETVAHIIWYSKNLVEEHDTVGSGKHKIGSLKDLVLAVPSWATQRERQAIIDGAIIAGFARERVALVHETSAAAVQRGFDLDLAINGTQKVTSIFLNMGSSHFEACIVHYGLLGNSTTPTAKVLGCSHSFKAGGAEVTFELAREAIESFAKRHPKKAADFRADEVAKIRMFRQAESVKHTLSANREAQFSVESVFDEIDFKAPVSRSDIERISAPILTELESTISSVLEKTHLTKTQIDQVEVIGGGWRVPCIQAKLEAEFAPLLLGQHLNGDESIVFGAAFIAANSSSNFRVRKIVFTDISQNDYALRVHSESAIGEWPRTQTIFPSGHKLNAVKAIKLSVDSDLVVDLLENGNLLESFSVTGRNVSAHVSPQMMLKVKLDSNGIVGLVHADAVYEYEVEQEVKTPVNTTSSEDNNTSPTEEESFTVSHVMVPKKDKVALKIETVYRAFPLPMSEEELKTTRSKLKRIVDDEDRIKLRTKVKNDLESLIYSIRDKMADDLEILANSSAEERKAAIDASHTAESWFDDNAWTASIEDMKLQIETLKNSAKPIHDRIQEKRAEKEAQELAAKLAAEAAKIAEEIARLEAINATAVPETVTNSSDESPIVEETPTEIVPEDVQTEESALDEL